MKSVSIVCTATQLLNCVEAIKCKEIDENDIVIIPADKNRLKFINILLDEYQKNGFLFNRVYKFHRFQINIYFRIILMRFFIWRVFRIMYHDIVILSNYKHSTQRFALNILYKNNPLIKSILVDDGMSVPELMKCRKEEINKGKPFIFYASKFYRYVYWDLRFKSYIPSTVEFFTIFDQIRLSDKDIRTYNRYEYIKTTNIGKNNPNLSEHVIIIIGQPLVQTGLVTSTKYIYYIEQFISQFGKDNTITYYYPHPAEKTEGSLYHELSKFLVIQQPHLPFELTAIQLPENAQIAGFFTSSLVNIKMLKPKSNLYAIYISEINLLEDDERIRVLNNVYEYLKNEGISVLKFN